MFRMRFPLREEAGDGEQNGGQADNSDAQNNNDGDNQEPKSGKSGKWISDLKIEVSRLRREKAAREEADTAAKNEAEAKKLEAEKNYEAAAKKRADNAVEQALKDRDAEHAKALKAADAKAELARVGFQNKRFIAGALLDFDPDTQSVEEFAQSVLDDTDSAQFLGGTDESSDGEKKLGAPPRGNNAASSFTPAKLAEWSRSKDDNKRETARKYKSDYWDKHNRLPPE